MLPKALKSNSSTVDFKSSLCGFHFRAVLGYIHPVNRVLKKLKRRQHNAVSSFKSKIILQSWELKVCFTPSIHGCSHKDIRHWGSAGA